jgi:hypothetical protein
VYRGKIAKLFIIFPKVEVVWLPPPHLQFLPLSVYFPEAIFKSETVQNVAFSFKAYL